MIQIYEPKGKAREYSPLALNYYRGCSHRCLYCYVPMMFNRFDSKYDHSKVLLARSKEQVLKEVESSARKMQGCNKQILFSFTTDPYNSMDSELKLTREVLKIMLKYGHKVSILTKAGKQVMRDIDLFKEFGSNIIIGQSITFANKTDTIKWENGASYPLNRIKTFRLLKKNGIRTWASFEPVIIPEQSLKMLYTVTAFELVDYVKIGKLNNYKGLDKNVNWTKFLNQAVYYCRKNDTPFYIKNDLLKFKDENLYLHDNEINQDFLNL
jgi:DNA repair photolyase